jgi:hypothetical protein
LQCFNEHERFFLVITPEGTRKLAKTWNRGFHTIALRAKVPIIIAFLDYKKKEAGIETVFNPTDNYKSDIKEIQKHYLDKIAKYPENFNLSIIYQEN